MSTWLKDMGGVVFLDEIGHASIDVQHKLLQLLSDRSYSPLGSNDNVPTECLIIAATNKDLNELCSKGDLLPDLYSRIQGSSIQIPPLRNDRDQIKIMLNHMWRQMELKFYDIGPCQEPQKEIQKEKEKRSAGGTMMGEISDDDRRWAIEEYNWPHNLRQLKASLEAFVGSGNKSFKQCVKDAAPSVFPFSSSAKNIILHELDYGLKEGKQIAENPSKFVAAKSREILEATLEWYNRHNDIERTTVFSQELKKMNSAVNQARYRQKKL